MFSRECFQGKARLSVLYEHMGINGLDDETE